MKKFLPILMLAFVGLFIFSCKDDNDDVDYDTYSQVRDITATFNNGNNYAVTQGINVQSTDVVLVYRRSGDAWQQIPKTIYIDNASTPGARKFDYNFVFDNKDVQVRIDDENFNLATGLNNAETNDYLNNQVFRIVLVPASAAKTSSSVDFKDYSAVIKFYNLNDSNVKNTTIN